MMLRLAGGFLLALKHIIKIKFTMNLIFIYYLNWKFTGCYVFYYAMATHEIEYLFNINLSYLDLLQLHALWFRHIQKNNRPVIGAICLLIWRKISMATLDLSFIFMCLNLKGTALHQPLFEFQICINCYIYLVIYLFILEF